MATRKPYNWTLLTRNNLYRLLYSIHKQVTNRELPVDQIQKIMSTHIRRNIPIRVKNLRDTTTKIGWIYIGGMYYSEIDYKKQARPIEINFNYNILDEKIYLTKYRFQRMCQLFADTILHEIVHMRQYRARKFKAIPGYLSTAERAKDRQAQEYYGDTDEMGAFSFNIACEMIDRFGYDPDAIGQYMASTGVRRHKRTSYYRYLKAFDWNTEHKIIRRLRHKVMCQLDNACAGKPFKTTDHLTY